MSQVALQVRENVTPEEWKTRIELAAAYRLVAHFGWDDLVFTHISARVPGAEHHFLINPYGLLFDEITASSLVKIDLDGKAVMDTPYFINPAGFTIHSAIHAARADVACVLHTHSQYGTAVSAQKSGLLPISQQSLFPLTGLAYHGYEGIVLNQDEKPRLVNNLGSKNFMILRNHGLLTCGKTVGEAFLFMYVLESACRIQILAQSSRDGEVLHVAEPIVKGITAQVDAVTKGLGAELVFPGLLRKLDRLDSSYKD